MKKEQVLLLLTLLLVVWIGRGYLRDPEAGVRYQVQALPYEASPVPKVPLVRGEAPALARIDPLTEPSETRPLPPRELAFPPRAPLSLAALPLDPGPDYGHAWLARIDGTVVDGVVLQATGLQAAGEPGADGAANGAGTGDAAGPGTGGSGPQPGAASDDGPTGGTLAERQERAARIYDRIWIGGLQAPNFGTIEAAGIDLFEIEKRQQFDGVVLRMRPYNLTTGKVGAVQEYGGDKVAIDRIALAGTLRNEVTRRVRTVPELPTHQLERRRLVEWLLEQARSESWVFDIAQQQAELYLQLGAGDPEAFTVLQQVLRARGDLAGEWQLLEGLAGSGRQLAYRLQALGGLKARLGLFRDAEQDLRKAAELLPTDARPHAALAEFLRRRGRSAEAVDAARRAEQTLGTVQDTSARAGIVRTIVACYLAMGRFEAAREALSAMPRDVPRAYVEGCIHYAVGNLEAALQSFRQASTGSDGSAALLGQAACHLRSGTFQEAQDALLQLVDQEPLLRHRALTGLALLSVRIGQYDAALGHLERALEAFPDDPYALYLRGRALRQLGQFAAAEQALSLALQQRDDFVHAIAEMSALLVAKAEVAAGEEQARALVGARRYADRAVALAPLPSRELRELQGLRAFAAADPRAALDAFAAARELGTDDRERAFARGASAVVHYSRGRVDEADQSLSRLAADLGREEPVAVWARTTLAAIADHAQKEALGDAFDRDDLGTIWARDDDATLSPRIEDGQLLFRGSFSRSGDANVAVERVGAVPKGKNFLAVGVAMQLGPQHGNDAGAVGLGIELQRGSGGRDLDVRVGIEEGRPFVRLEDGKTGGDGNNRRWLELPGFDASARHEIELRVLPRGGENSRQLNLQVLWNGDVVFDHELERLSGNTSTELKTSLFAAGSRGGRVDVAFDDYRLQRRKAEP